MRQYLANMVNGTFLGLWLLVPEHLRLGTWDLLRGWAAQPGEEVAPRLALQLVHEAALCVTGVREGRSLAHRDFEILNGLPFLATDRAVHELLAEHTVAEAMQLQVNLGRLRRASGHYRGRLLALDPHRMRSSSKREMRLISPGNDSKPTRMAQTFFLLDAQTSQPLCMSVGVAARSAAHAAPELLSMGQQILYPVSPRTLVLTDSEHFSAPLLDQVASSPPFELLVPLPNQKGLRSRWLAIPEEQFTRHWAGYATATLPYCPVHSEAGPFHALVQRTGEASSSYSFKAFLATTDLEPVSALTEDYPQRWHVEEFFNTSQDLGWQRSGTNNLNIRYAQMTFALMAQAALYQLRQRLGEPFASWTAEHLATEILRGLQGDLRVSGDTVIVTYYNAPHAEQLAQVYQDTPAQLEREDVDPRVPWLFGLKLAFRFK